MSLPEQGWKGHGRPGFDCRALKEAAAKLRTIAIRHDNDGHALRELAFSKWCAGTVFPAAINRWIRDIGARA